MFCAIQISIYYMTFNTELLDKKIESLKCLKRKIVKNQYVKTLIADDSVAT